jgi:hypothetical protein
MWLFLIFVMEWALRTKQAVPAENICASCPMRRAMATANPDRNWSEFDFPIWQPEVAQCWNSTDQRAHQAH